MQELVWIQVLEVLLKVKANLDYWQVKSTGSTLFSPFQAHFCWESTNCCRKRGHQNFKSFKHEQFSYCIKICTETFGEKAQKLQRNILHMRVCNKYQLRFRIQEMICSLPTWGWTIKKANLKCFCFLQNTHDERGHHSN